MTTSAVERPIMKTLVAMVDQHPEVTKLTRQRAELAGQLTAAQTTAGGLEVERVKLREEQHATDVAALLEGGKPAASGTAKRLSVIEADLERAIRAIAPLQDAIRQLDESIRVARARVETEGREQTRRAMRDLVSEQTALLQQIELLNAEILERARWGGVAAPGSAQLVRTWATQWRHAARGSGAAAA